MIEAQAILIIFLVLCGIGALLSLFLPKPLVSYSLACCGSLMGLSLFLIGLRVLAAGTVYQQTLWPLANLSTLTLTIDPLAGLFLCVTGIVFFPASIYAGSGLRENSSARLISILLFGLYASCALILISGDAILFLLAWECMSIFSYLLISQDRSHQDEPAEAGYLMLGLGELGTLAIALGFLILSVETYSLNFSVIRSGAAELSPWMHRSAFLLTFFGFGVKAGLIPVNSWLPNAYTFSPRVFTPILAGATLNMGLYGILRCNVDIMPVLNTEAGVLVLVIGTLSALIGILYATTENDLKKMLAHSSIENAGIITIGIGAGMTFMATHHPVLAAIALTASLYHLVNHSIYKTLLYFGAGSIESYTGTRSMDRLGGLIRRMPLTSIGFLVGTLSISALPPFNGFVSEWMTIQTMLRSVEISSTITKIIFALCGAGLALTAGLAITCFVKTFAMTFLGMSRSPLPEKGKEKSSVLIPIAFLSLLCLLLGILPTYVIPVLNRAIKPLTGGDAVEALIPPFFDQSPAHGLLPQDFAAEFDDIGAQVGQNILPGRGLVVLHRGGAENPVVFAMSTTYMVIILTLFLALTFVILRLWLTRKRRCVKGETWAGGIRRLLPGMTYTATGFSNPVRVIFQSIFRPTTVENTEKTVMEHFRTAIIRKKENVHLIEKWVFLPIRSFTLRCAQSLSYMHHGKFNLYASYTLLALIIILVIWLCSN